MIHALEPSRAEVERYLGMPVSDELWKQVVRAGAVAESRKVPNPLAYVADEISKYMYKVEEPMEVSEGSLKNRRGKGISQQSVVSKLLANIARSMEEVTTFRSEELSGSVLTSEEVPAWIASKLNDYRASHAVIVRLPKGFTVESRDGCKLNPPLASLDESYIEKFASRDFLSYTDGREHKALAVGRDGTLRSLQGISSKLARIFSWRKHEATMFVLTDSTPLVSSAWAAVNNPSHTIVDNTLRPLTCLTRITLTVDPHKTPREVAALYKEVRAALLKQRPRAISEKHLTLAAFASDAGQVDNVVMTKWNRAYPKWRYDRFSTFSRDIRNATNRLLHDSPYRPGTVFGV